MVNSEFKEFHFFENIDSDTLEYIFESAWDTLTQLNPNKKLDASDYFTIYIIPDSTDIDRFNSNLVYVTGLINGKPALKNLGTEEIIPIEINSGKWYVDIKQN